MTLSLAQLRPAWHLDAACLEHPELDWFGTDEPTVTGCRAVCDRCLVQYQCLDDAIASGLPYGVRGGLTGGERRDLRQPT